MLIPAISLWILDQVLHKRDAKRLCAFGSQSAFGGSHILGANASRVGAKRSETRPIVRAHQDDVCGPTMQMSISVPAGLRART